MAGVVVVTNGMGLGIKHLFAEADQWTVGDDGVLSVFGPGRRDGEFASGSWTGVFLKDAVQSKPAYPMPPPPLPFDEEF